MNAARLCVGAVSSSSSMCSHDQSSETIFSSAASKSRATAGSACSLIVTPAVVCGTYTSAALAPLRSPSAALTTSVMSTSWLRFCVVTLNSRTARILGSVAEGTFSDRELDGYRSGADRFFAERDEEYSLHYAGLKPEFELRAIYERHADLTDLAAIKRLGETV